MFSPNMLNKKALAIEHEIDYASNRLSWPILGEIFEKFAKKN